jgi:Pectate lyase superfamily protein
MDVTAKQTAQLVFNVKEYGAVGDGRALDTRPIQSAIDACHGQGGGTVAVPAGAYVVGALELRSEVTLYLDAGAWLLGSQDPADYPIVASRWEGKEQPSHAPLIGGRNLQNVALIGRGTIDGRGGVVEDVRVINIVMKDVLCPFTMNLYYACGAWGDTTVADKRPHPITQATPRFRRIHLSNITAREAKLAAAFVYGLPEMPVEDVSLNDVSISMAAEAEPGYPEMADDMELMARGGFFVRNARGLRLHNVEVSGQLGPALSIADSTEVEISASTSRTPAPDAPVVLMCNVEGAFVHGCRAAADTGVFLQLEGVRTSEVVLLGNSLSRAMQPIVTTDEVPSNAIKSSAFAGNFQ